MLMFPDPMHEGVHISDGMIGGIVGGLLFLFVAIILAVLAIKIFNKRKQREKAMRYGMRSSLIYSLRVFYILFLTRLISNLFIKWNLRSNPTVISVCC